MYYRVKQFREAYQSMSVLDQDPNLNALKARTAIDCAGSGVQNFANATFVESQQVTCISLPGNYVRKSDIIRANP